MKIRIAAITDVGKERENNEDALIVCPSIASQDWQQQQTDSYSTIGHLGSLLIVADGMGGANAGEVASSLAINTIKDAFTVENATEALKSDEQLDQLLQNAIRHADEAIDDRIFQDPDTGGMGTTIVVCWIVNGKAHIAWCGDSRCYVYHPQRGLKRLTKDHSLVQEMVDKGEITEKEAFTHPDSNIITRGLGDFDARPTADIAHYDLQSSDTLMLCSDGLCGYCTDKDIEKTFDNHCTDVTVLRDELLRQALEAGGYDNICIALASVIGDDEEQPEEKKQPGLKSFFKRFFGE